MRRTTLRPVDDQLWSAHGMALQLRTTLQTAPVFPIPGACQRRGDNLRTCCSFGMAHASAELDQIVTLGCGRVPLGNVRPRSNPSESKGNRDKIGPPSVSGFRSNCCSRAFDWMRRIAADNGCAKYGGSAGNTPQDQSIQGYYLATLTTEVGTGLPGSTLCIRFRPSGHWSSSGSENFNGTYLTSGKALFASGVWLPSPAVYMYLAGSINAKRGSGKFIIPGTATHLSGGGSFAMTHAQKGC